TSSDRDGTGFRVAPKKVRSPSGGAVGGEREAVPLSCRIHPFGGSMPSRTNRRTRLFLSVILSTISACSPEMQDPVVAPETRPTQASDIEEATLSVSQDTYLRQGNPNQNQGSESILRLQESGNNRILLSVSSTDLQSAVGIHSVVSAH